ncbi:MAG: TatD family hydrolase [Actinomycetota bacterium]|nr:TatD family hydrolase [Actinomycetota bacterium]
MIDSHTHLDLAPLGEDEVVAAAQAAGVSKLLTIGTNVQSSQAALAAAERYDGVWAGVGLHPNSAGDFDERVLAELAELADHPRCRAIGETGLDYYRDRAPREAQARAFLAHIELARSYEKPLVIHTREADQDTLDLLSRQAQGLEVLLHCFSMPGRLDECVERGYWISFAGNVTYPRNSELAAAAARVPLDRLLVETDAPYLTPQAVRKDRNQPAFVVHTARFVAEARGMSYEELEQAVEDNAGQLFGW